MNRGELAGGKVRADVVIDNVGEPEIGARKLLDAVYAVRRFRRLSSLRDNRSVSGAVYPA